LWGRCSCLRCGSAGSLCPGAAGEDAGVKRAKPKNTFHLCQSFVRSLRKKKKEFLLVARRIRARWYHPAGASACGRWWCTRNKSQNETFTNCCPCFDPLNLTRTVFRRPQLHTSLWHAFFALMTGVGISVREGEHARQASCWSNAKKTCGCACDRALDLCINLEALHGTAVMFFHSRN